MVINSFTKYFYLLLKISVIGFLFFHYFHKKFNSSVFLLFIRTFEYISLAESPATRWLFVLKNCENFHHTADESPVS